MSSSEIKILDHYFTIEVRDGVVWIIFETSAKVVVEMEYERQEFLRYFTNDHATRLETYLQQRIYPFQ
jgi:hypothetical protein